MVLSPVWEAKPILKKWVYLSVLIFPTGMALFL